MAQHNTDYGLVYDDEGKLCVTKRTDIIPFSGVTSYAVETATTNYLAPYAWEFDSEQTLFYPGALASGKTWADCWDEKQKAYVGGEGLTCRHIYTRSIDLGSIQAAGTKITLSWKHKGTIRTITLSHSLDNATFTYWNSEDTLEFNGESSFREWLNNDMRIDIDGKSPHPLGNPEQLLDRWYNVEITYTLPSDARYIGLRWDFYNAYQANGGLGVLGYIRQPQLEIKPFASSFVNGSRSKGSLVVDTEDLGFNPGTDDWVVSYRKYPIATGNDILTGWNDCSLGYYTQGYYFVWGKHGDVNKFRLYAKYNDDTYILVLSPTFNPDDYFRHWHSEVVLRHGNEMEYWVDGVLQCQATLTTELIPNYANNASIGLMLGGSGSGTNHNSLITNITYGKYTDQWTTEYIQRISAMTSTFYVPTKRVIV